MQTVREVANKVGTAKANWRLERNKKFSISKSHVLKADNEAPARQAKRATSDLSSGANLLVMLRWLWDWEKKKKLRRRGHREALINGIKRGLKGSAKGGGKVETTRGGDKGKKKVQKRLPPPEARVGAGGKKKKGQPSMTSVNKGG